MLQRELVPALRLAMVRRAVFERYLVVRRRIVGGVGRVENARRAPGVVLVAYLAAYGIGNEGMPPVHDFPEKRGRHRVYEVRRKAT